VPERNAEERLLESKSMKTRTSTIDDSASNEGVVIALLTITAPGADTVKVPITNLQTKLVIGRDARADIPINNQVVSRLHAIISHDRGRFFIEDLHSKNGTVLNGKYLPSKPVKLSHGDEVRIGKIIILFQNRQAVGVGDAFPEVMTGPLRLIPTGYRALDVLLGGGIPSGYAVVLLSQSCDERDLLLKRIIESSVRFGRPTFLMSDDLSKITQFAGFSRDFYAFSTRVSKGTGDANSGPIWIPRIENLSELNISLSEGVTQTRVDQKTEKLMVIETLPDILLHHKSTITRRWLSEFIAKRKAQSFTLLFTLNPSIASESEVSAVVDLFDGVMRMRDEETKGGPAKLIGIKRMFARKYESKEILLTREEMEVKY
jgi:KaiC/GvpD/RAD55 family RecA-like ATPase